MLKYLNINLKITTTKNELPIMYADTAHIHKYGISSVQLYKISEIYLLGSDLVEGLALVIPKLYNWLAPSSRISEFVIPLFNVLLCILFTAVSLYPLLPNFFYKSNNYEH